MITPDFSGRQVRSQSAFERQTTEVEKPSFTSENKTHHRSRQKGHILIEKHGHKNRHSESSPRTKRREHHKDLHSQTSSPKKHHFELAQELNDVSGKLGLCYEELKSSYMKEIAKDVGLNTVDLEKLLALKDLFQQLMNEMVHLRTILSHCDINTSNNGVQVEGQIEADNLEKTELNNQDTASDIPCPNDLVHLKEPVTENAITTTLQARFNAKCCHTKIGPVHLIINNHKCKDDTKLKYPNLIVTKSLEKLFETHTPQMLILSGESGSGKSYTTQLLIKELMHLTCGPSQTDLLKQLDASVTVLNSLGKARTITGPESSKVAVLYEFHFNNQVVHKTNIRCIPLSMSRIVKLREGERNFRIFYQLFAGLSPKERVSLRLQTHSAHELRYLYNYPSHDQSEIELLRKEFQSWKSALQILAIPFTDVTKVLAAILLLGNVQFTEKSPRILEVQGGDFELKAVAILLGVPYISLFWSLTKKLKVMKSDATIQSCSANQANFNRDALAKSLYLRMLSAIVRRCNCSRKSTFDSIASLTKSNDHLMDINRNQVSGNHEGNELAASPDVDGQVLGIADLFGFDKSNCNGMEQICANLCSETVQHFYTTHIFKRTEEFCREEGIENEVNVDYQDNSECIELLTCQETGILTYLDQETLKNGSAEPLVEKLGTKHSDHKKFFTTNCKSNEFGIAHHAAEVIYDADELLRGNDDSIGDDVIQMFSSEQCSFGFVVHLFASDLKSKPEKDHSYDQETTKGFDSTVRSSIRTFSQEYQERLDELLKTLIHADPWFILCIKSNMNGDTCQFDPERVSKQIKSLQIFETVQLLRSGYSHRMRFIPFAQRYFVHDDQLSHTDALEIAQSYQKLLNESKRENPGKILYIGRKHVFFSEILWQELEKSHRKKHQDLRRNSLDGNHVSSTLADQWRKKISPIMRDESRETSQSRAANGPSTPPAIPKRRGYTIIDNKKIAFPQIRVMTDDYRDTENGQDVLFSTGESVKVIGASPKAGYLAVESRHKTGCVPYKLTILKTDNIM